MMNDVVIHYDKLIEEDNDPVHDPKPLRDYMDKWDGPAFIKAMRLSAEKNALEIGVGTGRIAVKTAPLCRAFSGIDISPKTIERARENLMKYPNVSLYCADFLEYDFDCFFDVIYTSLTFMHIKDKQRAIHRISGLLTRGGRFVISIDKNPSKYIDTGNRRVRIYPDDPDEIAGFIRLAGLRIENRFETEFAYVFAAVK